MMFSVSGATTPRDLANARVVVNLDLPVIITLRVEDSSGAPIPGAIVNIATPSSEGTWEGPVNERGEIVLFGEVGSYFVMLASVGRRWLGRAKVIAHFEVTPHDVGERVVVLRVPSP